MAIALVVPVYNGYGATRRCLETLARHTPTRCAVILVDDASTDARIAPLLAQFAAHHPNAKVLANERNLGFVGAVNRAIAASRDDLVILNSDTEVTAGWLEGLERCRASDPAFQQRDDPQHPGHRDAAHAARR